MKQPQTFDSQNLREDFLDELIQRCLLAREATRTELDSDQYLSMRVSAYQNQCMREAHYRKTIEPQIKITESDIQEAYPFTQDQRRIRHLFTETRAAADSLYQQLKEGVPFENLAEEVFADTDLAEKGGDLGWIQWAQMEYNLGMAAFRQKLNEYSSPVQSQYGWHIIQVLDYKKNPLITRHEYELHCRKAEALLKSDQMAAEMIRNLMQNADIKVYPRIMKPVGEQLSLQLKRKPSSWDIMNEMQLSNAEVIRIRTGLREMQNEILAEVNGEPLTVGEFICDLPFVPYDALYRSYKSAMDFVFRDVAITKKARAMGLDRSEDVRRKTQLYQEYLLQLNMRKRLIRNVRVTEAEITSYYQEKQSSQFKNCPFDSVKLYIRNELLKEKRRQAVPEYIQNRFAGIKIEKYPERIHAYYESVYHPSSDP